MTINRTSTTARRRAAALRASAFVVGALFVAASVQAPAQADTGRGIASESVRITDPDSGTGTPVCEDREHIMCVTP